MKLSLTSPLKKGFTLLELMVAMAITTIIVTILVSITSISLDAWNRSRAEIRASRQAKTMVDTMARDFEALVARRGNTFEWLNAKASLPDGNPKLQSSNAAEVYFFTSATDRYEGDIGGTKDLGGDVSCVGYNLEYKDPIQGAGGDFKTFVLNRKLVDPKETFEILLGQTDLPQKFPTGIEDNVNFVCENVYQFSLTFNVEVLKNTGTATAPVMTTYVVPLTISDIPGNPIKSLKMLGSGLEYEGTANSIAGANLTPEEIKAGRITSVEVSLTVISDFGIEQLRKRTFSGNQQSEFLNKNSYQYSKRIQISSM